MWILQRYSIQRLVVEFDNKKKNNICHLQVTNYYFIIRYYMNQTLVRESTSASTTVWILINVQTQESHDFETSGCVFVSQVPYMFSSHMDHKIRWAFLLSSFFLSFSLLCESFCPFCWVPIDQCEIFVAGLCEGPTFHLWTLKRVANIAYKK